MKDLPTVHYSKKKRNKPVEGQQQHWNLCQVESGEDNGEVTEPSDVEAEEADGLCPKPVNNFDLASLVDATSSVSFADIVKGKSANKNLDKDNRDLVLKDTLPRDIEAGIESELIRISEKDIEDTFDKKPYPELQIKDHDTSIRAKSDFTQRSNYGNKRSGNKKGNRKGKRGYYKKQQRQQQQRQHSSEKPLMLAPDEDQGQTSEEDIADVKKLPPLPPPMPTSTKVDEENDGEDKDSGSYSTDNSDIEVSMKDYYTIRMENDVDSLSKRRLSLFEALAQIPKPREFEELEKPEEDDDDDDGDKTEEMSDSSDDESKISNLEVNEKDYYVIRKQSEVFSGVEFVLDFNQVESLVSIKSGGKDDKKKKSLRASQKFMSLDERSQIHVKDEEAATTDDEDIGNFEDKSTTNEKCPDGEGKEDAAMGQDKTFCLIRQTSTSDTTVVKNEIEDDTESEDDEENQ